MRMIDADELREKFLARAKKAEGDCMPMTAAEMMLVARDIDRAPTVELPRWIRVEDRLPETYVDVLVCNGNEFITVALYDGERWMEVIDEFEILWPSVTHWMPLPEPPEEVVEDD